MSTIIRPGTGYYSKVVDNIYTTSFKGRFDLGVVLRPNHREYLKQFSRTLRLKRDAAECAKLPDWPRCFVNLPPGIDGEFYVSGQSLSVIDFNTPPSTQPSLRCHWAPTVDGTGLIWDGEDQFKGYIQWLEYLIENFFDPWGYALQGQVAWAGKSLDDMGTLIAKGNKVTVTTC